MHGDGRVILITGATDGIGLSLARRAVTEFDKVIVHGRNRDKCKAVKEQLIKFAECRSAVEYEVCDFFYSERVFEFIDKVCRENSDLYAVINNAGIFNTTYELNSWGLESMYAVNHFAAYIIQTELARKESGVRHILNTGSLAHLHVKFDPSTAMVALEKFNYHKSYAMSKLCCIMQTYLGEQEAIQRKLRINCYDPGFLNTKLTRNGWDMQAKDDFSSAVDDVFYILNEFGESFRYIKDKSILDSSKETVNTSKWKQLSEFNDGLIERIKNDG